MPYVASESEGHDEGTRPSVDSRCGQQCQWVTP